MLARLVARYSRIVVAHPIAVLVASCAIAALAAVPASRLSIRSDVASLLPEGAPAAAAYRTFLESFGGIENVFIVLRLPGEPDPDRLADAAEALARTLSASPVIAHARWGLDDQDEDFFSRVLSVRLPLLLGPDAPTLLAPRLTEEALVARAREIRDAVSGPGGLFLTRMVAADPIGLAAEKLEELAAGTLLPFDPMTGALLAPDGRAALVVATPRLGESDAAGGRALAGVLEGAFASTRAALGADLLIDAVGGPLYAAHDETALRADLVRIVTTASVLVLGLIVLAFRGPAIPAISMATIAVAQLVAAAIVAWGYGPVTAVGVGFAAILLGLGDDFVIHLGMRMREAPVETALREAAPGIVAAGATTGAAFACLAFAQFRPLRDLGTAVAIGMALLLVATATVGAPLLVLASRRWRRGSDTERRFGFAAIVRVGIRVGERWPRQVVAATLVATAIAALGLVRLTLDTDLRRFRPEDHPSMRAEQLLAASFAVPLDTATIVVPGDDADRALERADAVATLLRTRLPKSAEVFSPSDWIVTGERSARRVSALRPLGLDRAALRFERALENEGLRSETFARSLEGLRTIASGGDPEPVPLDAYPAWMRDGVKVGPDGAVVAVRVRVPAGVWRTGPPADILESLRGVAPGVSVASVPALGAELRALALADLRRLGALALGVVFLLVIVSYRGDMSATLLTFVPVLLGIVWTAGLWGWLGRPLDLFSLCVLPVMVGIGIDDGLHVLHLARRRGADLARATQEAGRGVVLTNLTTSAGFAALAVSHVPALRNGGLVVCAGNLMCLSATLLLLPAVAALSKRR